MNTTLLALGLWFALKHFICDGPLQTPYQYLHKGQLLHPGGWVHAGHHALWTAVGLLVWADPRFLWLAGVDLVAHYVLDFCKVNLTDACGWARRGPRGLEITSPRYFYALVADQSLHFATYAGILATVAS